MQKRLANKPKKVLSDFYQQCGEENPVIPDDWNLERLQQGLEWLKTSNFLDKIQAMKSKLTVIASNNDPIVNIEMTKDSFKNIDIHWFNDLTHLLPHTQINNCVSILIYEKQKTPIRILEIGCGTGLLTRHLVKLFPNAEFLITDIAPEMVKRAQKHFSASSQKIRFEIVDGELFQCSEQFDLIVSSMTFQWFECLPKALTNLVQCLRAGGILICSTLSDQSFIEWQHIYADQKKPCSLQKYPSIKALQNYWPKIGYGRWEEEFIVCPIKDGKSFLKEFHEIGAKTPRQNSYPLNAGTMRRLIHQFDQKYNSVTYHVAYGFYQRSRLNGSTGYSFRSTFIAGECSTKRKSNIRY